MIKCKQKILFAILTVSLFSCGGSDSNSVNSSSSSTTDNYGNYYSSSDEKDLMTNLKSSLSCTQTYISTYAYTTGNRLTKDASFTTSSTGSSTSICTSSYQSGSRSGTTGLSYVGISPWNDIMIVTEIVSGSSVTGYNIKLSMCELALNTGQGSVPLISDTRALSSFLMINPYNTSSSSCIYLDKDNYCSYGVIDSANSTYMQSQTPSGTYSYLEPFNVWTTFYKPTCNSNW